jgi:hypothetical protein
LADRRIAENASARQKTIATAHVEAMTPTAGVEFSADVFRAAHAFLPSIARTHATHPFLSAAKVLEISRLTTIMTVMYTNRVLK